MKILVIAVEVAPFAKVGGLADVAGALPKALKALGHDVRVVMPAYAMIENDPQFAVETVLPPFSVTVREGEEELATVKRARIGSGRKEIPVYLLGNAPAGGRRGAKGYFQEATESKKVYTYAVEPYAFFCRAVLEMLPRLSPAWIPDVLHCNDWHTGLVPVYQQECLPDAHPLRRAATVFTVHNLAYQGNFSYAEFARAGLPYDLYIPDRLEFYGQWTFMKGGLTFSDRVNTVSRNYACEIQTPEYGCGLEGLMRHLFGQGRLSGILNGIDQEAFDPARDPHIPARFSAASPDGKARCKAGLQAELGLSAAPETPVIGIISRLADQKGFDLIHAAMPELLKTGAQIALLGTGDPHYAQYFKKLASRHPQQVAARIAFDAPLAQRIYAGSDLFLMPSRYEPCGLGQLISLRYGTIPIVRATGGLADTISDYDPVRSPEGNGFVFVEYSPQEMTQAIRRALNAYGDETVWRTLTQRALTSDFSWTRSAERYAALYAEAMRERSPR